MESNQGTAMSNQETWLDEGRDMTIDKKQELIIINSSGGLMFSTLGTLSVNETLILASTIHSLLEMIQITHKTPAHKTVSKFESWKIYAYKPLDGHTFVFLSNKSTEPDFEGVYRYFCETVLQDYSYVLGMPVKVNRFDPSSFL